MGGLGHSLIAHGLTFFSPARPIGTSGRDPNPTKTKFLDPDPIRTRQIKTWIRARAGPDPNFFPPYLAFFCIYDQVNDQDFKYFLVALGGNANIRLFFVVFFS